MPNIQDKEVQAEGRAYFATLSCGELGRRLDLVYSQLALGYCLHEETTDPVIRARLDRGMRKLEIIRGQLIAARREFL